MNDLEQYRMNERKLLKIIEAKDKSIKVLRESNDALSENIEMLQGRFTDLARVVVPEKE